MEILLGIVIPTFNRIENLKLVICALSKQTYQRFVVNICDSGSTDGTKEYIKSLMETEFWKERLTWLGCGPKEIGRPARSRNIGINNLPEECELFYLLDSDVIIPKHCLEKIVSIYKKHNNCMVMPLTRWMQPLSIDELNKVVQGEISEEIEMAIHSQPTRHKGTFIGDDLRTALPNNPFSHANQVIDLLGEWVLTANILIPRKIYEKVGVFNEEIRGYGYEDIEYGFRAERLGIRVYICTEVVALHVWHGTENLLKKEIFNQINLNYVACRFPEKKDRMVDIDWKYWWHYCKKRGGKLYTFSGEYWVVNSDQTYRMKIAEHNFMKLGYSNLDVNEVEFDKLVKIKDMGFVSEEYDNLIWYLQLQ